VDNPGGVFVADRNNNPIPSSTREGKHDVQRAQFARRITRLSPRLDEFSVLRASFITPLPFTSWRPAARKCPYWPPPNSAGGRDTDRFRERPLGPDHQQFSIPVEQKPGVRHAPLPCFAAISTACWLRASAILLIDQQTVRPNEHPPAGAFGDVALRAELEDGVDILILSDTRQSILKRPPLPIDTGLVSKHQPGEPSRDLPHYS
jgi:hypothetical protein